MQKKNAGVCHGAASKICGCLSRHHHTQQVCIRQHTSAYVSIRQHTYARSVGVSLATTTRSRYAHVCSRMLTYAHVCSRMLTCAHVCSRMLTNAAVRVCLSPPPHSAGLLPLPRRPRQQLPQLPTSPGRLPLQVRWVFFSLVFSSFFFREEQVRSCAGEQVKSRSGQVRAYRLLVHTCGNCLN
jgi:hypothetical protein